MKNKISSILPEIKQNLTGAMIISRYSPHTDLYHANAGNDYRVECFLPGHNDSKPSLMISKNKFVYNCFSKCNGPDSGGDFIKLIMVVEGCNFTKAIDIAASMCGISTLCQGPVHMVQKSKYIRKISPKKPLNLPPIPPEKADHFNMVLMANWKNYGKYFEDRMISKNIAKKYNIGVDWYKNKTIPIYNDGKLVNIRYRNAEITPGTNPKTGRPNPKYWSYSYIDPITKAKNKYGKKRLFNIDRLKEKRWALVIVSAGEFDSMVSSEIHPSVLGVSATVGEGGWDESFCKEFEDTKTLVCYDNDEAGFNGASIVLQMIPGSRRLSLEGVVSPKGDLTDFIKEYDHDTFLKYASSIAQVTL